jgi:hypothetical protein
VLTSRCRLGHHVVAESDSARGGIDPGAVLHAAVDPTTGLRLPSGGVRPGGPLGPSRVAVADLEACDTEVVGALNDPCHRRVLTLHVGRCGQTPADPGEIPRTLAYAIRPLTCGNVRVNDSSDPGRCLFRSAHNPEVAGSNPAPATKVRGPFHDRKGPSACRMLTDPLTEAWFMPLIRPPCRWFPG